MLSESASPFDEDGRVSERCVKQTAFLKKELGADRESYVAKLPVEVRDMLNQREADSVDIQHALLKASCPQ